MYMLIKVCGNFIQWIFDGGVLILKRRVIDLELAKISMKKLETTITFDREVRWRRVKNESCSKRDNESPGHYPKGIGVH